MINNKLFNIFLSAKDIIDSFIDDLVSFIDNGLVYLKIGTFIVFDLKTR